MAIIISVGVGQWNSLIGILGITSNVIFEILVLNFSNLPDYKYELVLLFAFLIIGIFYALLIKGSYSVFEKLLALLVSIMGLSFIFTLFFFFSTSHRGYPWFTTINSRSRGAGTLIAAFVGTTMASATFLSRLLFIQGKGWKISDFNTQKKDAFIAAVFNFYHQRIHHDSSKWEFVW